MSLYQELSYLENSDLKTFSAVAANTFSFHHRLALSPLVQMDALRDLVRHMHDQRLSYHFECAEGDPGGGWGSQPSGATLLDGFDALPSGNALVILKSVHRHPDYAQFLSAFLEELGDVIRIGEVGQYKAPICTIILASPNRITPYHMDDAHNFLMQVQGSKAFYVFDGTKKDILSDREREAFWGGNSNAALLTEARQRQGVVYNLVPGSGIHVPMAYPHWAQNGPDVSVAVSVNFRPAQNRSADIHAFNSALRRRGLHPRAAGQNRMVDDIKVAAFRTMSSLKQLGKRSVEG